MHYMLGDMIVYIMYSFVGFMVDIVCIHQQEWGLIIIIARAAPFIDITYTSSLLTYLLTSFFPLRCFD
jgi:hypothetical protein